MKERKRYGEGGRRTDEATYVGTVKEKIIQGIDMQGSNNTDC